MRTRIRGPFDGWSKPVLASSIVLLAVPLALALTTQNAVPDTGPVAVVLGTTLTALVFLLSAAQKAHDEALKSVLDELERRQQALFDLAGESDTEPWPELARAELDHAQTVAAVAALAPGDRRWRKKALTRRTRAHDKAWRIEWTGARKLLEALGPGNDSGAQTLLDQALTVGGASALPDSMRECWDWETHAKERRSSLDYIQAVDDEYERVRDKALFRNSIWPSALKVRQPMSALADDLERKLEEQLGPLGTAYVLIAAMVALQL